MQARLDTKQHYLLLDALRGVVALMVVWYHVFEGFAFAQGSAVEVFNHGHLGVDFFFMLSGFVISYAYDDRWKGSEGRRMSLANFLKRRLIRLHPMLMMGTLIGVVTFLLQGGVRWDGTETALSWIVLAFVLAIFLIPAYPGAGYDVRGNGEMYALNGPVWSLFFEYIGNALYALFIRRFSNRTLLVWTVLIGVLWGVFAITDSSGYGMIGVGWTLDAVNFFGGLLRMLFPFSMGMLMARNFRPLKVRGVFPVVVLLLFGLFSVPHLMTPGTLVGINLNSLYEVACVMFIFPVVVWCAASEEPRSRSFARFCKGLGDLSYPLYTVHYPVMYLFYAWLIQHQRYTLQETWPAVLLVLVINITLAYVCLKCYDEPVRRWLSNRVLSASRPDPARTGNHRQ